MMFCGPQLRFLNVLLVSIWTHEIFWNLSHGPQNTLKALSNVVFGDYGYQKKSEVQFRVQMHQLPHDIKTFQKVHLIRLCWEWILSIMYAQLTPDSPSMWTGYFKCISFNVDHGISMDKFEVVEFILGLLKHGRWDISRGKMGMRISLNFWIL